jgi:hypothetical protein
MNFFQYLFCNQYAEISGRGGDGRKAQMNTLILSAALITLYIIIAFVVYGRFFPGYLEKNLSMAGMSGKNTGRLLAVVIGIIVFFMLKFFIGTKTWYDQTVKQFNGMLPEEQKRTGKKGLRYFFIAALPVIIFMVWALASLF